MGRAEAWEEYRKAQSNEQLLIAISTFEVGWEAHKAALEALIERYPVARARARARGGTTRD